MHFLITAGGTREYIDPVRFLSNASSGKMGYALARAALRSGHDVTLITAPTHLRLPKHARIISIVSAADMFCAVKTHFTTCDCLVMAAAVADYTPAKANKTKIKKSTTVLTIRLRPTMDILAWAGKQKTHQIVVGFALEDKHLRDRAERKCRIKNLDMIVANEPTAIDADVSTVWIKPAGGKWKTLRASKDVIARRIIRHVVRMNMDL
ncbi:MAG: phosphopantothenoylcysteine decarboxylase [Sedimentisphaerales bacterium]|nr:phosphopantothenoylcysteine decarboxylase [Sedimentisphaerales bacterium]